MYISLVVRHGIVYLSQVCVKRQLKGGLECKLILTIYVGFMHKIVYNCISFEFCLRILDAALFDTASHAYGGRQEGYPVVKSLLQNSSATLLGMLRRGSPTLSENTL